jgi:DNA-binding NarL/FixJ family response regulator
VVAETMAMRVGLREVINNLPDLTVVSATARSDEILAEAMDVLVVVPPADTGSLQNNQAVLYLTDDASDLQELLYLGYLAWGALPVNASEEELNIAIHALAEGLWVGAPILLRDFFPPKQFQGLNDGEQITPALTGRETEVLQLAAQGLANKQIAMRLGISEHTIKFHLSSLYAKLGVSSRTEAVRAGVRRGIVVL